MRLTLFLSTLLIALTTLVGQAQKRAVTVDDFFGLKSVGNSSLSPDGKWVAYTISTKDIKTDKSEIRVWMRSTAGGDPIPMTGKGYSASNPKWSPDGKFLSFTAAKGEKAKTQVWTLNRMGGEAEQLTKEKFGVSGYEWSPNSKQLLLTKKDPKPELLDDDKENDKKVKPFVIDRRQFKRDYVGYLDSRRNHLYVYTIGDTASVQITSGDYDDGSAKWSPDGSKIVFVSNRSADPDGNSNSDIWIVDPTNTNLGANLVQVTTNSEQDGSPSWSPDGSQIVYVTNRQPADYIWYAVNNLATVSAKGGTSKVILPNLDRNVSRPTYSSDGKSIYFELEDSGERQLCSVSTNGKNFKRVVSGGLSMRGFHQVGNQMVLNISKPYLPRDLFLLKDGNLTQLGDHNRTMLDSLKWASFENIQFNSADGTEIEGFVYKPADYVKGKKYPTILRIHGGPTSQYDFSFRFDPHFYAANGYVVIETNPRGSSGYGQAFSYALFANWGGPDTEDVIAGVDYLIDQGIADPERLGVGGWSYGGILTNYIITRRPDKFKAAVSGASEALYRANYGHDHYQLTWELELGLPWVTPEKWEKISPFNDLDKIKTPTLWMGGQNDWNVPILNSEQMYMGMKRLGMETQLVVYPGEHHGIRKLSFQKDRYERFLGWYDKYVK